MGYSMINPGYHTLGRGIEADLVGLFALLRLTSVCSAGRETWKRRKKVREEGGGWRSSREEVSFKNRVLASQHSSDRPVNIAKLKAHNLWAVWGPGAIPWIMAPLTRLELRRASARDPSSFGSSPLFESRSPLLSSLPPARLTYSLPSATRSFQFERMCEREVVHRTSRFSDIYFRRGTFAQIWSTGRL